MNDRKNRIRPASLNHTYRLVWSEKSQSFVAVAEITPGRGKAGRTVTGAVAGLMLLASSAAWAVDPGALPDGESLTHGDATFTRDGDELIIEQGSERIITEWERFNIGEDAGVRFDQPGSDSAALNRILDENPSQILGRLEANGQIFLTNPAGITFGEGAQVNVGSLVASTLEISDEDFLDGRLNFENRGSSDGRIKNRGEIEAAGGVVALIANEVSNQGEIRNDGGDVALAAGDEVTLDFDGDGLTTVTVERGVLDALVENGELIRADGGQVVMTTQAKNAIYRNLVNNEGTVRARTLEEGEDGRIMLSGGMEEGEVRAGGTLDASAPDGGDGGRIETSAAQVDIDPDIEVTTHAEQGQTGEWVIDPTDVYIVEGDEDGGQLNDDSLADGVTTVHNNTLESALETTSVTIETPEEGGEGAGDIFVDADVAWSENTLTLSAYRDIEINRHLDASAGGHLTLEYAQGDAEGDYRVNMAGGYVDTTDEGRDYAGRISLDGASTFRTRYADDAEIEHNVITDASELDPVRDELDADHVLGGDVDLDGFSANAGWEPVGDEESPFTGGFDGLGNSIGNLTIDRPDEDEVGLFGHAENASFRHLQLQDIDVTGKESTGGLVGYWSVTDSAFMEGVQISGGVTGKDNSLGGLIGRAETNGGEEGAELAIARIHIDAVVHNDGTVGDLSGASTGGLAGSVRVGSANSNADEYDQLAITRSLVTGSVTSSTHYAVGGLVGELANLGKGLRMDEVQTSTKVTGTGRLGGIVGEFIVMNEAEAELAGLRASGDVVYEEGDQGEGEYIGGLFGEVWLPGKEGSSLTLENAHASGNVSGIEQVGGLVGKWGSDGSGSFDAEMDSALKNVYATGTVSGEESVGGLIGQVEGEASEDSFQVTLENAYATGAVEADAAGGGLLGRVNLLDGSGAVHLENVYASNTVNGSQDPGGLVGRVDNDTRFTVSGGFYDRETNTDDAMLDADVYGASRAEIRGALEGEGGWTVEDEANATDIEGYGLGLLPYLSDVTIPEDVNELPMATLFEGGWGDAEGDGAYTVARADQLQNINQVADRTFDFELVDDVDLPAEGDWTPIGDENAPFNGQLDGQGYAVRHLTLDDASRNAAGLFGAVADARLMNLRVEGAAIEAGDRVGALAGVAEGDTRIEDVFASGSVAGGDDVGGLVGVARGSTDLERVHATTEVTGDGNTGGLLGRAADEVSIRDAYASNTVNGGTHTGGVAGATGGDVVVDNVFYDAETNADAAMQDADERGAPRSEIRQALEGVAGWTVEDVADGTQYEGYALGRLPHLTDVTHADYVEALPMATLFEGGWGDAEGDGAYTVARADQLQNINQVADRTFAFELVDDVDLPAEGDWTPIGDENAPFNGQLDGQGYAARQLTLDDASRNAAGLFGAVADARLMNLYLEAVSIEAGDRVGALAGVAEGDTRIEDVFASGSVAGGDDVGGLVGVARGSTDLERVHATTEVTGDDNTGGLLGRAADEVSIRDAYASNTVNGGTHTGGVAGATGGDVDVDNVFYDAETNVGEMDDDHRGVSRQAIRRALEDVGGWDGQDYDGDGAEWEGYRAGSLPSLSAVDDDDYAMSLPMATLFGGGFGGTEHGDETAYEIARTDHLRNIHEVVGDGYAFELANDLDLADEANWDPIGDSDAPFVGRFDGQGYAIRNLTIDRPDPYDLKAGGLFGVALNAILRDLVLEGVDVVGDWRVGALVGRARARDGGTMTISDVVVSGEVAGEEMIGGLVGETAAGKGNEEGASVEFVNVESDVNVTGSSGHVGGLLGIVIGDGEGEQSITVTDATVNGDVEGVFSNIGGLIGGIHANDAGNMIAIEKAQASGQVAGRSKIGGLVGQANNTVVKHSYANGPVTAGASAIAGGLIGTATDTNLTEVYATGSVEAGDDAIAGGLLGVMEDSGIDRAYATGAVTVGDGTDAHAGGFVGRLAGGAAVSEAYSAGRVEAGEEAGIGGFAGDEAGDGNDVEHSYWDTDASGVTEDEDSSGIANGRSTEALQDRDTFTEWSLSSEAGDDTAWRLYDGAARPLLRAFFKDEAVIEFAPEEGREYDGSAVVELGEETPWSVAEGVDEGLISVEALELILAGADAGERDVQRILGVASPQQGYDLNIQGLEQYRVDPRSVTLAGDFAVEDKIYDSATDAPVAGPDGLTLENLVAGEDLELTELAAAFANADVGDNIEVSLTDGTLADGDNGAAANYRLTLDGAPTTTATIDPRELTLGGEFSVEDREYDGSVEATLSGTEGLTLENLVNGEDLALTDLAAAFADANAGEAITVNLTEAALADGDEGLASNYTLLTTDWPTTTASIDPRTVTLGGDFGAEDKVYDGSAEATLTGAGGLTLESLVDGEDLELTDLAAAFADAGVGEGITVNLVDGSLADGASGDAGNYRLSLEDAPVTTATIDPRELTLGGEFSAEDKAYDGTDVATIDTTDLSLNNLVEGEALNLESLTASFEQSDVGENLAVSLSGEGLADGEGGSADNYILSLDGAPTTTATIDPRAVALGGDFGAEDKLYDGRAEATLTGTGGLTLENLVDGEDLGLADLAAAFAGADAGDDIEVSLTDGSLTDGANGDAANYRLSLDGAPTTTATIDPRELTLGGEFSAEDKVYDGSAEATLTGSGDLTLENLVAGEDLALTDLAAAFAGADAGDDIEVNLTDGSLTDGANGDAANYRLGLDGAPTTTATIDPRTVTLGGEFSVEDREYDGTTEAALDETEGLILENLVDGEDLGLTALKAAFADANAGEAITVNLTEAVLADGDEGLASNYTLLTTDWPTTTATIDPRTVTPGGDFGAEDKVYDGSAEATLTGTGDLTLENLVAGEDLALTDLAAAFAGADAGDDIEVNLTDGSLTDGANGDAANYRLGLDGAPTTTATIDPRTVTLGGEFSAEDREYDGTTEAALDETDGLSLENLVDGEDLELTDLAAAFAEAGPGEDIEVSLTNAELGDGQNGEASNYVLSPEDWPMTHASIEPESEPEPEQGDVSAGDAGSVLRRADDSAGGDTAIDNEGRADPAAPDMAVGPISGSATLSALMQSEILVDERDLSGPVELVDDDDSEEGQ